MAKLGTQLQTVDSTTRNQATTPPLARDEVRLLGFHEPLANTLARTVTISLVAGALLAWKWGGVRRWPIATLLMLWPALGGHLVELFFLNFLRPRLPSAHVVQIAVRVVIWFAGGVLLAIGMMLTAMGLESRPARWNALWIAGLGFIGIELGVHLVLQLLGRGSFYNGRG